MHGYVHTATKPNPLPSQTDIIKKKKRALTMAWNCAMTASMPSSLFCESARNWSSVVKSSMSFSTRAANSWAFRCLGGGVVECECHRGVSPSSSNYECIYTHIYIHRIYTHKSTHTQTPQGRTDLEAAEDEGLGEVELLALGYLLQLGLRRAVLLLIRLEQLLSICFLGGVDVVDVEIDLIWCALDDSIQAHTHAQNTHIPDTHLDAGLQLPHQLLGVPLPERVHGPAGEEPPALCGGLCVGRVNVLCRCPIVVMHEHTRICTHPPFPPKSTHPLQLRIIWSATFPSSPVMRGAVP